VSGEVAAVAERTRAFVREVCIPAGQRFTGGELDPVLRRELQQVIRRNTSVFAAD
jgi:hypothetical protein